MQKEAIVINGNKTGTSSLPMILFMSCIHLTQEKLKYLWGGRVLLRGSHTFPQSFPQCGELHGLCFTTVLPANDAIAVTDTGIPSLKGVILFPQPQSLSTANS